MAQHDYNLANAAGATFRADANSALAAIVSQNSGATEPATMFAYQWWADTTTGILKQRNAANSDWVPILTLATGGILGVTDGATTTTTVTAIADTDFVDTNLAAGGKRKILWTAVKTYLATTFAALAGSASQDFAAKLLEADDGVIAHGSIGAGKGAASAAAGYGLEVQHTTDAMMGLYCSGAASTGTEAAYITWANDAASLQKTSSYSVVWGNTSSVNGYNIARQSVVYKSASVAVDDLQAVYFAGRGQTLGGGAGASTDDPSAYGDANTKILARGLITVGLDVNGAGRVFGGQNVNAGASALARFRMGSLTSEDMFNIDVYGSGHGQAGQANIYTGTAAALGFGVNGSRTMALDSTGNVYPETDNSVTMGKNGNRWSAIWAANGTIQTSDINEKCNILPCDFGLDFITALEPISYQFKVGQNLVSKEVVLEEVEEQAIEEREEEFDSVSIVDGVAITSKKTRIVKVPLFDTFPMQDESGAPVLKVIKAAVLSDDGVVLEEAVTERVHHGIPRMIKVMREVQKDVVTPREGLRRHYGLSAQGVKAVIGDADAGFWVYDPETERQGLRYEELIAPMIKAIQELKAEFEAYKVTHP